MKTKVYKRYIEGCEECPSHYDWRCLEGQGNVRHIEKPEGKVPCTNPGRFDTVPRLN